ncbi:hypothetical protein OA100_01290, partial [Alphaproteobacteria bacterium]|nr:hypothetical protein [Alphaproteobacteria bacterium]
MQNQNNQKLFLDPESINAHNRNIFFDSADWPFKEKEFKKFSNYLLNNYYQLMEKTSKEVFYASLIETKMINIIINICHYQYVVKYCKRKNIHYVYSLQSKHLREPEWNTIKNFYSTLSFPHNRFKRILRRYVKFFFFNKKSSLLSYLFSLNYEINTASIGSFDLL